MGVECGMIVIKYVWSLLYYGVDFWVICKSLVYEIIERKIDFELC